MPIYGGMLYSHIYIIHEDVTHTKVYTVLILILS